MTTEAPYTDPDGYPSWQPNAEVREADAWSRRYRTAMDAAMTAAHLVDDAKRIFEHLSAESIAAWVAVDEIWVQRPEHDPENPNRPYRPEV